MIPTMRSLRPLTRESIGSAAAEAALLAAAVVLYARTMSPSIAVGDAGELALAAHVVGIPHPPGYPLYTLAARLATVLLPLRTVALALNHFSILCAAGALLLHLRIGRRAGLSLGSRLAATALLAGSATFWSQACIAEVYALHMLLVHAVLLAAIATAQRAEGEPAVAGAAGGAGAAPAPFLLAYALGLALAHHPSSVLLAPVAAVAWARARRLMTPRAVAMLAALVAIPFTLFATLVIRSQADPAIDWGNPETLSALVAHVARAGYHDLGGIARSPGLLAGQLAAAARFLADDLTVPLALGTFAGLALLLRSRSPAVGLVALAFALASLGTIVLVNFPLTEEALYDNRVFFLPAVSTGALAVGALFEAAGVGARRLAPGGRGRALVALVAVALTASAAARRIPRLDRRDHTVAEDLGRAMLIPVDPGATLLATEGQTVHSLAYVAGVLGMRADVRVVDRLGVLGGGHGIGGRALPEGRIRSSTLFATSPEPLRARGLTPIPWGLAFRGGVGETPVVPGVWASLSFRRPEEVASIDFAEREILVGAYLRMAEHVAWAGLRVRGASAIDEARRIAGDAMRRRFAPDFARAFEAVGDADSALALWGAAAAAAPGDVALRRQAGLSAGRLDRWAEADAFLAEASRLAPADAAILAERGSARLALGDTSGARAAWERALALDPASAGAARGLGAIARPPR
jgi:hypothetical protein